MAGIAWVNGRLVAANAPAIAATDRGFLYGEGLFETMRAYRGRVFRLPQHLDRLEAGATEIGLSVPPRDSLEGAVHDALAASGLPEAGVRLTVTPGPAGAEEPTCVVLVRPLSLPPPERYRTGCAALSVPVAVSRGSSLRGVKSLNYLDKLLAQRQAERAGAHEALLVDPDGCVVEGAMRNVFAVCAGTLVTPPLSRGLLPGITRAAVLELARQRGFPHAERDLPLSGLLSAEEAFLTSSLAEILPVASVNGARLRAAPGPMTRALTEAYRESVARELGIPNLPDVAPPSTD